VEASENLFKVSWLNSIFEIMPHLVNQAKIMSEKYDVVITNPPYLGNARMNPKLSEYISDNFAEVKSDLSMVMYKKAIDGYLKKDGYIGFITTTSWMYLKSFESIRKYVLKNLEFETLVDFGTELFDGKVGHNPIVAWVNKNSEPTKPMVAIRLVDYCYSRRDEKMLEFFNPRNRYVAQQKNFFNIPGMPIAYWVSENAFSISRSAQRFEKYASTRAGMITGNNHLFIRLWHEISYSKMGIRINNRQDAVKSRKKWFPYNKGGEFRKWYGNNDYVVNWENDGDFMRNYKDKSGKIPAHAFNLNYIFKENVTWSSLSSYKFAARYTDFGFLYDASGSFADVTTDNIKYTLALLCSEVTLLFLSAMNPTLNFQKGNISELPYLLSEKDKSNVDELVSNNILISKIDWDNFETSWDFIKHPFVQNKTKIYRLLCKMATVYRKSIQPTQRKRRRTKQYLHRNLWVAGRTNSRSWG